MVATVTLTVTIVGRVHVVANLQADKQCDPVIPQSHNQYVPSPSESDTELHSLILGLIRIHSIFILASMKREGDKWKLFQADSKTM